MDLDDDMDNDMCIEDQPTLRDRERYNGGLRNIFEEYDNNFSWNELNIYDLH